MQKILGCVRNIHAYSNTYIPKENFDRASLSWSPQVRKARLEGGWYSGQGKVYDTFNYDLHTCDEFKIPTDWPVTPMIDFHPCIEQAIGFYAVDKPGWKYVVDEIWEHLSAEEIADAIIRRKVSNAWRIDKAFIDPYSKGDNKMMTNRMPHLQDAFTIISHRLAKHGIRLEVALKEGRDYLDAIDKDPVFGREQLYEEGPYNSRLFSREEALRFGVTNPDDVKAFIDIYCRGTREE